MRGVNTSPETNRARASRHPAIGRVLCLFSKPQQLTKAGLSKQLFWAARSQKCGGDNFSFGNEKVYLTDYWWCTLTISSSNLAPKIKQHEEGLEASLLRSPVLQPLALPVPIRENKQDHMGSANPTRVVQLAFQVWVCPTSQKYPRELTDCLFQSWQKHCRSHLSLYLISERNFPLWGKWC